MGDAQHLRGIFRPGSRAFTIQRFSLIRVAVMVHEGLWEQLVKCDGPATARRARCEFEPGDKGGKFTVVFRKREYVVDLGRRRIFTGSQSEDAGFLEQLCLLAYLIGAKERLPRGKLVKAQSLQGGDFYFRGIHELPTGKLAETFGEDPHKLYQAIERFGGQKREYGDACVELLMLPRVPLTIVIWSGDEEFAARSSLLFDAGTAEQIALDALGAAVSLTVKAIIEAVGED